MTSLRSVTVGLAVVLSLAAFSAASFAQRTAPRVDASAAIPSPKSVLGFTPGDDRTIADWSQITNYFTRLDRVSDRVTVETLGQSTLKRPQIGRASCRERG